MTAAVGRTVTIALPLPPASQSANARASRQSKAADTKQARRDAYYAALGALLADPALLDRGRFQRATVAVRYVVCGADPFGNHGKACPMDLDGAQSAVKAYLDGALVDSGILVDDNARRLVGLTTTLERHGRRQRWADCPGSGVWLVCSEVV